MRPLSVLLACLLIAQASAQSSDLLSVIFSQGYSLLTSLTASLGQTATRTAATPSSNVPVTTSVNEPSISPSSDPFASTFAPPTTVDATSSAASVASSISSASASIIASLSSASITGSAATASALSSLSRASDSASAAAASATSAAADSGGNNNRDRNLAIILGTVLGALALGLLILLIVILCHRRRRRRTRGAGSLSSTSDEALTGHHTRGSHVPPFSANRTSRRRSLLDRNHAKQPLMTERSNYDVPSAHQFGHGDTVPFVPTGASNRNSGVLPTDTANGVGTGLGPGGRFPGGTGLNSHPYHEKHHTGTAIAAGAGGAALGAAAARRSSRSGERHHGTRLSRSGERPHGARLSRSGERHPDPRLSGDPDVHPAFWDGPPPRSPNRISGDSRRHSGSMTKGTFHGPMDHTHSPLRQSHSSTPAGVGPGLAAAAAADRVGHRNHERGRSLPHPDLSPSPGYSTDTTLGGSQVMPHSNMGTHHATGPSMYNANPSLVDRGYNHPHHHGSMAPAVGAAAVGAGLAAHSRSRSRSGPQSSIPPALFTGNGHQRRSHPSRSPKRTRFSSGETHHDPMPYQAEPTRDGAISPPTANREHWQNMNHPAYRGSSGFEEPISPVSPDDLLRAPSHRMPMGSTQDSVPAAAPLAPSVSPQIIPPTTTTTSTTIHSPTVIARHHLPPRQNSGLVTAVQDHFDPTRPPQYQPQLPTHANHIHHQNSPSHHQPFTSDPNHPSTFSNPSKPLSRKPVPYSEYNTGTMRPDASTGTGIGNGTGTAVPDPNEPRRSGENWWRGEEDSAWRQSYSHSGPGIGHAR